MLAPSVTGLMLCALALMLTGVNTSPVMAQDKPKDTKVAILDAKAAKSLISDRVWQIKRTRGPGYDYWSWHADGSFCVRLGEQTGKCADTGHWKLDGERLCYELTWWGEKLGLKSACFRISDHGKGNFGGLQDNGLTLIEFSVTK